MSTAAGKGHCVSVCFKPHAHTQMASPFGYVVASEFTHKPKCPECIVLVRGRRFCPTMRQLLSFDWAPCFNITATFPSLRSLNYAPRHEGVLVEWSIPPPILDLGTKWRWVASFIPRPLYPPGKNLLINHMCNWQYQHGGHVHFWGGRMTIAIHCRS